MPEPKVVVAVAAGAKSTATTSKGIKIVAVPASAGSGKTQPVKLSPAAVAAAASGSAPASGVSKGPLPSPGIRAVSAAAAARPAATVRTTPAGTFTGGSSAGRGTVQPAKMTSGVDPTRAPDGTELHHWCEVPDQWTAWAANNDGLSPPPYRKDEDDGGGWEIKCYAGVCQELKGVSMELREMVMPWNLKIASYDGRAAMTETVPAGTRLWMCPQKACGVHVRAGPDARPDGPACSAECWRLRLHGRSLVRVLGGYEADKVGAALDCLKEREVIEVGPAITPATEAAAAPAAAAAAPAAAGGEGAASAAPAAANGPESAAPAPPQKRPTRKVGGFRFEEAGVTDCVRGIRILEEMMDADKLQLLRNGRLPMPRMRPAPAPAARPGKVAPTKMPAGKVLAVAKADPYKVRIGDTVVLAWHVLEDRPCLKRGEKGQVVKEREKGEDAEKEPRGGFLVRGPRGEAWLPREEVVRVDPAVLNAIKECVPGAWDLHKLQPAQYCAWDPALVVNATPRQPADAERDKATQEAKRKAEQEQRERDRSRGVQVWKLHLFDSHARAIPAVSAEEGRCFHVGDCIAVVDENDDGWLKLDGGEGWVHPADGGWEEYSPDLTSVWHVATSQCRGHANARYMIKMTCEDGKLRGRVVMGTDEDAQTYPCDGEWDAEQRSGRVIIRWPGEQTSTLHVRCSGGVAGGIGLRLSGQFCNDYDASTGVVDVLCAGASREVPPPKALRAKGARGEKRPADAPAPGRGLVQKAPPPPPEQPEADDYCPTDVPPAEHAGDEADAAQRPTRGEYNSLIVQSHNSCRLSGGTLPWPGSKILLQIAGSSVEWDVRILVGKPGVECVAVEAEQATIMMGVIGDDAGAGVWEDVNAPPDPLEGAQDYSPLADDGAGCATDANAGDDDEIIAIPPDEPLPSRKRPREDDSGSDDFLPAEAVSEVVDSGGWTFRGAVSSGGLGKGGKYRR